MAELLKGHISHDKVTRFLHAGDYGAKELWQPVKPQVRQAQQAGGVLILDDTVEKKAYTDKEGVVRCYYCDHAL